MKSRRINTPTGLTGWLDEKRIELPLKGVKCDFDVTGNIVEVQLQQIFYHNGELAFDCLYSFPLPADATVFLCEMHINDRVVVARAEEKQAAKRQAERSSKEGYRTMLIEGERDNLFTLSLTNVQPGDLVVVLLSYYQLVEGVDRDRSMRIPFTPGIRYIPGKPNHFRNSGAGTADDTDQVSDASRISPPRIDEFHTDAAYLLLKGQVNAGKFARVPNSSSHEIDQSLHAEAGYSDLTLAEPRDVPDRDFVLNWQLDIPEAPAPRGWRNGEFGLIEITAPKTMVGCENFSQDVWFLLDRSGSMGGDKWEKATQALLEFINILGPEDRASVTVFESRFEELCNQPESPGQLLRNKKLTNLPNEGVLGGTELLPALKSQLKKIVKHSLKQGRHASIVLITDGQVGNESAVIDLCRKYPKLRVHCFGIDHAVNDGFLKKLSGQQRGICALQTPEDDITKSVVDLGRNMRQPVLLEIQTSDEIELVHDTVPDLFGDRVLSIPVRFRERAGEVAISAKLAEGIDWGHRIQFEPVDSNAISKFWAKSKVDQLLASGERKEAISLAVANNILCEGVSFLAIDESEKTAVSKNRFYQPSMKPEGHLGGKFKRRTFKPSKKVDLLGEIEDSSITSLAYSVEIEEAPTAQCEENSELKKLLKMGLSEIELPLKIINSLSNNDITTVGFLATQTENDLSEAAISSNGIDTIKEKLHEVGLSLGMAIDPSLFESRDSGYELEGPGLAELISGASDQEYSSGSIQQLSVRNHIRKRPGMYIGSVDSKAISELLYCIVHHVVTIGASEVEVNASSDGSFKVIASDLLLSSLPNCDDIDQAVSKEFKTGKYESYHVPIQAVGALSERLTVSSGDGIEVYQVSSIEGEVRPPQKLDIKFDSTRTVFEGKWDSSILEAIEPDTDLLISKMRSLALNQPSVSIHFQPEAGPKVTIQYPNGVADRLFELLPESGCSEVAMHTSELELAGGGKQKIEAAISSGGSSVKREVYVQDVLVDDGIAHDALNRYLEPESSCVISISTSVAQFSSQAKSELVGPNDIVRGLEEILAGQPCAV